ncbi:RNA recognition motif domain-containing protein [Ditylenchus destructor]|nr:RNA recognition motif domain-containing protein [Ditylenchus destructor]
MSADPTRLYIGGLEQCMEVTKEKIRDTFGKFGPIRKITLRNKPQTMAPRLTPLKSGFAFVEYENAADADKAFRTMQLAWEIPVGSGIRCARVELSRGKRNTGYQRPRYGQASIAAFGGAAFPRNTKN